MDKQQWVDYMITVVQSGITQDIEEAFETLYYSEVSIRLCRYLHRIAGRAKMPETSIYI